MSIWRVHVARGARPAWQLQGQGPARDFADRLQSQLRRLGSDTTEPFDAPYWMEAALWEAHGIPSLVCGPAGGGLHASDEWVDTRQLRLYAEALAASLAAS